MWKASQRWKKETEEAQTEIPLLLIFSYDDNVSEPDSTIEAKI